MAIDCYVFSSFDYSQVANNICKKIIIMIILIILNAALKEISAIILL